MTKSKVISLPDLQEIDREAALWLVRLDGESMSESDYAAFDKWYKASTLHQNALEKMSEFWCGLAVLKQHTESADLLASKYQSNNTHTFRVQKNTKRYLPLSGIAAAILAVVVSVFFWPSDTDYTAHFETVIGEQKTIRLIDGSTIILNTASNFDVSFSKDARTIDLHQGEAYFEVVSNPARPFSVRTKNGIVTAVGTAFSVKVSADNIDVLVTEGRIALDSSEPIGKKEDRDVLFTRLEVSAGQSVIFDQKANHIDVVEPELLEKKTDWHDGLLIFKGEPLGSVIAEIGRYTDMKIDISDEELRNKKVVAYYRVGNIDEMFEALNLMSSVEIERFSKDHVRLYLTE